MVSFLPLFMEKQVGLSTSAVVWLQTGSLIGGLASTFLWGWAADRYGSKPVMLSSIFPKLLLPIGWLLMPQNSPFSIYAAMGIALVQGVSEVGWAIGSSRLLFVSVVPTEKKTEYMAVYYAAIGLIGGFSQLIGGWILDATVTLDGRFLFLPLNPYTPLFLIGLIFLLVSLFIMRQVQADHSVTTSQFAGMFLQGNPFLALGTLPRYYLARDERTAVAITERLGQTKSPLTVEELLDALNDARFNVRFEAVISIARMPSDPRLVHALQEMLNGTELSLSTVAAWALGRIGDEHALASLRDGLNSDYRSIRAHCARALGALNDQEVAPLLLERLVNESDSGLQMAYASTLGNLRATAATQPLLDLLATVQNPGARRELALSLARIIGNEQYFINLLRQMRGDTGTTIAQQVTMLAKRASKRHPEKQKLPAMLKECADTFAHQQLEEGVTLLSQVIRLWEDTAVASPAHTILQTCADQLDVYGITHEEYILLALHTMAA
jgi:HEAT repeat protein